MSDARFEAWDMAAHHADRSAISFSMLERFGGVEENGDDWNPAEFIRHFRGEATSKTTDAMRLGTLLHSAVYEPQMLLGRIAIRPTKPDGSLVASHTKAYAEWLLEHDGKIIVTPKEADVLIGVAEAAARCEGLRQLVGLAFTVERSITWKDDETGLRLKVRPDRILVQAGLSIIEDLKSTDDDVTPMAFRRTCFRYRYFDRMAFYLDGVAELFGEVKPLLVAAKKREPFEVVAYEPRDEWIERGRAKNRAIIREIARRFDQDDWLAPWQREITIL